MPPSPTTPNQPLRSAEPFFHRFDTINAIQRLASKQIERLVIYCGAGVTIDRTGLSWSQLLVEAFKSDKQPGSTGPTSEEIAFLFKYLQPAAVASILVGDKEGRTQGRDLSGWRESSIRDAIYFRDEDAGSPNPRLQGRLVGSIARLAPLATSLGKSVTIVTTNYDEILEDRLRYWIDMHNDSTQELDGGGTRVKLKVFDCEKQPKNPEPELAKKPLTWQSKRQPGEIGLLYLHGRVSRRGNKSDSAVLTERDYARTRPRSMALMQGLLDYPNTALVTVGASLTDPPLVDAIALTKRPPSSLRVGLVPVSDMGFAKADQVRRRNRLVDHAKKRGEEIGIEILMPDFNIQIAQFFLELTRSLIDPRATADPAGTYGRLLKSWWNEWNAKRSDGKTDSLHEKLKRGLAEIEGLVLGDLPSPNRTEKLRLELWVRTDADRSKKRVLERVATSGAVNRHPESNLQVAIELESKYPAVLAFTKGQPLQEDCRDKTDKNGKTIQRGFWAESCSLAVPIWLQDEEVPVGVLCLASNRVVKNSVVRCRDSSTRGLMEALIRIGHEVLKP